MIEHIATPITGINSPVNSSIQVQSAIFKKNEAFLSVMRSLSQMIVVLNDKRQIVYANNLYYKFCNIPENNSLLGLSLGASLYCGNASHAAGGCGTTEFCKNCGSFRAILESYKGFQSTKECRIITQTFEAKDLQVTATPYDAEGHSFTIFALMDISDKKRKEMLERVFFHDILNSAGGISGLSAALVEIDDPEEINDIACIMNRAADNMVEEIQMQRQLNLAERGELIPDIKEVNSLDILKNLKDVYDRHNLRTTKTISISEKSEELKLKTDPIILRRILENMLKNALEVYNPKAEITLSCNLIDDSVVFAVHNPKYIDIDIQHQLFKRSFSTKGIGRGLGTYSMKLLGEKYLNGKVGFKSLKEEGTTFFIKF